MVNGCYYVVVPCVFLSYFGLVRNLAMIYFYLVVDKKLHRVVAPFNEHQLVGLSRNGVGDGSSKSRILARL